GPSEGAPADSGPAEEPVAPVRSTRRSRKTVKKDDAGEPAGVVAPVEPAGGPAAEGTAAAQPAGSVGVEPSVSAVPSEGLEHVARSGGPGEEAPTAQPSSRRRRAAALSPPTVLFMAP